MAALAALTRALNLAFMTQLASLACQHTGVASPLARLVSSLKKHGNTEPSSLSVIPSRPRDARPCRGIYAERFAFISHRFALISPHTRVGWGLARLVEMTNHAATPSPSVLLTFLRYDTSWLESGPSRPPTVITS